MCPGTLAIVATAAKVGGDLIKGVSAAQSAAYNAQVARNNATIERQNAAYAAGAASADTQRAGLEARAKLASTRTAIAANNLDVNSGSAADTQASQRMLGSLDTATVAGRGANKVYGYQGQATSYQAQANLDQAQVVPDLVGAGLSAVGDAAGGAPSMPSGPSPSLMESSPSVGPDYTWMQGQSGVDPSSGAPEFGG